MSLPLAPHPPRVPADYAPHPGMPEVGAARGGGRSARLARRTRSIETILLNAFIVVAAIPMYAWVLRRSGVRPDRGAGAASDPTAAAKR